jgi:hypothetical protein
MASRRWKARKIAGGELYLLKKLFGGFSMVHKEKIADLLLGHA